MAAVEVVFRLMVMQLVFDVHNVASRFWSQSLPSRTNAQLFVWHAALVEKVWSISRCPVCNLLVRQSWNLHFEPYNLDNDNVYIQYIVCRLCLYDKSTVLLTRFALTTV